MTTLYVMDALENYDPARVALITGGTIPKIISTDTSAFAYDPVSRNIYYTAAVSPSSYVSTLTNPTPYTLWDGQTSTAPGATISTQQGNWAFYFYTAIKNIDTGTVTFYNNYSAANIVPASIGGDGTSGPGGWRRTVTDVSYSGGNLPNLIDPRTGDFWFSAESCETYLVRKQDNFALVISPFVPVNNALDLTQIQGLTVNYAYIHEPNHVSGFDQLYLIPRLITAGETSADKLLASFTYSYPFHSASSPDACWRPVIDANANMYVAWMLINTTRAYKLAKFTPGSGFSDVTPWDSTHGPNTNAASYTGSCSHTGGPNFQNILMDLRPTGNLALISKFQNLDKSSSTNPADTFFDCTYINPSIASTFDYHSAFVKGYMDSTWTPQGSVPVTGYVVLDCIEHNVGLNMHDYDFSSIYNYSVRKFLFLCNPIAASTVDTNRFHAVIVTYSFVYGNAPALVGSIIDEGGWDSAYAAYAAQCVTANTTYGTTDANHPNGDVVASSMQAYFGGFEIAFSQWQNPFPTVDAGIYDPTNNAYWYSGQNADMFLLNPTFAGRFSGNASNGNPGNHTPNPPFLRLTTRSVTPTPGGGGKVYMRQGKPRKHTSTTPAVPPPPPPPPPSYPDGFPGRPVGAVVPYPNLLSGYAFPPPWHSPGVQFYGVGPPAVTNGFSPDTTPAPLGSSFNASTKSVVITGPAIFDGWNFGTWGISITGSASNWKITNSTFAPVGPSSAYPSGVIFANGAGSGTFTNNFIDGTNAQIDPLIAWFSTGTLTQEYNWFKNAWGHMVQVFPAGSTSLILIDQFNLYDNWGLGLGHGPHPQPLQIAGNGTTTTTNSWNTYVLNNGAYGGLGVSWGDNTFTPTLPTPQGNNNTIVLSATPTTGGVTGYWVLNESQFSGAGTISNNYYDITGITGVVYQIGGSGTLNRTGNINMKTGAALNS